MTSQPIRLSTNFMTLIPSLTFTELWVVSMEHLQRVWLASGERLPFGTPGSIPLFGTCLCSNCWDQIPQACHVFTQLFTLNTPGFFHTFDFALLEKCTIWWLLKVWRPTYCSRKISQKKCLSFCPFCLTVLFHLYFSSLFLSSRCTLRLTGQSFPFLIELK